MMGDFFCLSSMRRFTILFTSFCISSEAGVKPAKLQMVRNIDKVIYMCFIWPLMENVQLFV